MKRFSKTLSILMVVALIAFSFVGCTTAKVEDVPSITVPVAAEAVDAPAPAPAPAPEKAEEVATEVVADSAVEEAVVEEAAPAVEDTVVVAEETAAAAEEAPVVYPYGVTEIVKNTQGDKDFDLFIVHTNDVHARVTDYVGYSKLSTMLKTARSITDNILVLDAGDVTHGTNFANLFNGTTIGELLMMVGYDAVAPGNHDFNYGVDNLKALAEYAEDNSNLRVLCANATDENGNLIFQPYQIYNYNGFKVAVIGLTTPDTKTKSHPKNTVGVEFMSDEVVANAQAAIDLAHEIADYVVVLGHIGVDADGSEITSRYIIENIKGIDLFVDGHSHTLIDGEYIGDTLLVQAGEHMKNVGVVEINVRDGKVASEYTYKITADDVNDPANSELAKMFGITEVPNDPEVDAYIEAVNEQIEKELGVVIANVPFDLDGERANVRTRQTNLSKMICEAMTEAGEADFTITNGGGIRASIPAGDVTKGDVFNVLPFGNTIMVCEVKGEDVYKALEHGYSMIPETNGAFSQSDLKVVYSKFSPAGSRIKKVFLPDGVTPIDKEATYLVATNDFMAAGGDGYEGIFGKKVKDGIVLNEVLEQYLAANYPVK